MFQGSPWARAEVTPFPGSSPLCPASLKPPPERVSPGRHLPTDLHLTLLLGTSRLALDPCLDLLGSHLPWVGPSLKGPCCQALRKARAGVWGSFKPKLPPLTHHNSPTSAPGPLAVYPLRLIPTSLSDLGLINRRL